MARKEFKRVYHGVPNSTPDSNTLFFHTYESNTPKIDTTNSYTVLGSKKPISMPSGVGTYGYRDKINIDLSSLTVFTLEGWITINESSTNKFFSVEGDTEVPLYGKSYMQCNLTNNYIMTEFFSPGTSPVYFKEVLTPSISSKDTPITAHYLRIVFDKSKSSMTVYVNGVKTLDKVYSDTRISTLFDYGTRILIRGYENSGVGSSNVATSEVQVSKIDRGDYFPNLPQDFIDGKAIIVPKLGQRQRMGDPVSAHTSYVSCNNMSTDWSASDGNKRYCLKYPELSKVTTEDSITLSGLCGELIGGTIDTNTALARVTSVISSTSFFVDDATGLSMGDKFKFFDRTTNKVVGDEFISLTISDNIVNNKIEFSGGTVPYIHNGLYLIEVTTSSSSPIVKDLSGTTLIGEWNGLGTNSAVFVPHDFDHLLNGFTIEYSLICKGGISPYVDMPKEIICAYDEEGRKYVPTNNISNYSNHTVLTIDGTLNTGNPIIIQPQTKTVFRHKPSREPFTVDYYTYPNSLVSLTESQYVALKGNIIHNYGSKAYVHTYGTGAYVDYDPYDFKANDSRRGLGDRIKSSTPSYLLVNEVVKHFATSFGNSTNLPEYNLEADSYDNLEPVFVNDNEVIGQNYHVIYPSLAVENGEFFLYLAVRCRTEATMSDSVYYKCKLPNAPLVKEVN